MVRTKLEKIDPLRGAGDGVGDAVKCSEWDVW